MQIFIREGKKVTWRLICMHTYMYTIFCFPFYVGAYKYIHIHIHIYSHTHTHTHTYVFTQDH